MVSQSDLRWRIFHFDLWIPTAAPKIRLIMKTLSPNLIWKCKLIRVLSQGVKLAYSVGGGSPVGIEKDTGYREAGRDFHRNYKF